MAKKKIVIVVDNPLRDLPACALLATELAKSHQVFLTPMAQAGHDIFHIRADLVLLNYLRVSNLSLVDKLIKAEIAFSILDTEGGIFQKLNDAGETSYTKTILKDSRPRMQLAQYFVWGEKLAQYLSSNQIYPAQSIQRLGTPRMDFYHSSFAPYFATAQTEKKPLILINTSFPGINPKFSTAEKEAEMLVQKFSYSPQFVEQLGKDLTKVMHAYIELTAYLAKNLPDVQFVLRPHPFESLTPYQQALGHLSNVNVNCDGAVSNWLWQCKALIHYECSTALEAAFLGRPNFSLAEFKNLRPMEGIDKVTEYYENPSQILERIRKVLNQEIALSPTVSKHLEQIEKDFYTQVDGLAYHRIGRAINDWISANRFQDTLESRFFFWTYKIYYSFRSLMKLALRGTTVPTGKQFGANEVQMILDKLTNVTGVETWVNPKQLSSLLEIKNGRTP